MTALMRMALPAHERQRLLQPAILASNLSSKNLKSLDGDLVGNIGSLR